MPYPVVILAGGLGTRLREETEVKPKPMVEIGGRPVLWHIMKMYAAHGCREFVICLGYKGEAIKEFFLNYRAHQGSLTVGLGTGAFEIHADSASEDWTVHLVDTGYDTMTGGRIKRAAQFLGRRPFLATYGDGVSDIDVTRLIAFHEAQGRRATVTAVRPPARFGGLILDAGRVATFEEKPQVGEGWINGGFMAFEAGVEAYIADDATILERGPLEQLAAERQLAAYEHPGFWQCMDTVRDVTLLRELWARDAAPWKSW